ncbi:hypothetical protein [Paraburkholderia sp. RCC_158]|uniref:hypothetical protein n=1 Tax=Paraburkholderia sp. RCC_158 TaxID=3239220 RepID=UPI0035249F25
MSRRWTSLFQLAGDAALALADPDERQLLGNFDRLFLRVKAGKITLDMHLAVRLVASRCPDQPRMGKEFSEGETGRCIDDSPTVSAFHDCLQCSA